MPKTPSFSEKLRTISGKLHSLYLFLLFREPNPRRPPAEHVTLFHAVLVMWIVGCAPIVLGLIGMEVWGAYTFVGFCIYFVGVAYGLLQVLHVVETLRLPESV